MSRKLHNALATMPSLRRAQQPKLPHKLLPALGLIIEGAFSSSLAGRNCPSSSGGGSEDTDVTSSVIASEDAM
ncbi:MAG: hypothetical protein HC767_11690 [Akkermansiaceae bacterium]|nr:hypothetical protein [Akkermansiaceae bacterium]